MEGYCEKGNILRWKLERSSLWNCFVTCDFHALSYSCISWICVLAFFLLNLRSDISNPFANHRTKGNILRWKWERSFLRNFFVICEFISQIYSCISWSCLLALFLWNLRTVISDQFEDYRAKGNIRCWKWERSFLRNFFVICEFISQSYSFPHKKPFAKTILVGFEKWYLEPLEGYGEKGNRLRWKLKRSFLRNCFVFC